MNIFKKKNSDYSVLTDNYVPASLPTYGQKLENYVPAEYPMNKPETIETVYHNMEAQLKGVIATCDRHSAGSECDSYIDSEMEHYTALHEAAVANNENQIVRIRAARKTRKEALEQRINPLKEKIAKLTSEIEPLEKLHPQFQLHIGRFAFSIGLPITIVSMIVDAAVNYGFLQTILLSNTEILILTVIAMSLMSDFSMNCLANLLSRRKEKNTSKPIFCSICIGLVSLFVLSVVASVMIRIGSMDTTFGTINAAGQFVPKTSYSLADYGTTLVTSFLTTSTGILSFAFSMDENAFAISVRKRKKKELAKYAAELEPLMNEWNLLENAPDPQERDKCKRAAAEHQMEATRLGLKLHCRKQMAVRVNDADFTERMVESGRALLKEAAPADICTMPSTTILEKVS